MSTQPVDGILPVELVMEIVMKIPARFLVGLRCVCKSWNALITDSQFVSTFFNRNNNTRENFMFLGGNMCHKYVAMFRINEQPRILYDTNTMDGRTRNSFNFSDCFKQCMVVGSINGIICLFSYWRFDTPFVVLWNPTISYWKLIFIPQHKDEDGGYVSIGLAFDSLTNDYKIIRLVSLKRYFNENLYASRIEVYSAKHDSWSVVNSRVPFLTPKLNCSLIHKGVPYWLKCYDYLQSKFIASVDPHTGSYKKIMYPQIAQNQKTKVRLFNLMDSLALLIYSPGDQTFHVYALDDEKSCATTWINIYSTSTPTILQNKDICTLRCFEDAGKVVVVGRYHHQDDFFLYDLKNDCLIDSIGLDFFQPWWKGIYHHVDSLIYILGMEPIETEDE